MALHYHLLVNGKISNPPKDPQEAIDWLTQLVEDIGMNVIQGPFASYIDKPGNRGLTATVMIETSHIAFHVWDEEDPAMLQFDLYTCSTLDWELVMQKITDYMGLVSSDVIVFNRANGFEVIVLAKRP